MYESGALLELNALIDPALGLVISSANGINDQQQIAATGCWENQCYAWRLDPISAVPEADAWMMLVAGLGMLGLCARRAGRVG